MQWNLMIMSEMKMSFGVTLAGHFIFSKPCALWMLKCNVSFLKIATTKSCGSSTMKANTEVIFLIGT